MSFNKKFLPKKSAQSPSVSDDEKKTGTPDKKTVEKKGKLVAPALDDTASEKVSVNEKSVSEKASTSEKSDDRSSKKRDDRDSDNDSGTDSDNDSGTDTDSPADTASKKPAGKQSPKAAKPTAKPAAKGKAAAKPVEIKAKAPPVSWKKVDNEKLYALIEQAQKKKDAVTPDQLASHFDGRTGQSIINHLLTESARMRMKGESMSDIRKKIGLSSDVISDNMIEDRVAAKNKGKGKGNDSARVRALEEQLAEQRQMIKDLQKQTSALQKQVAAVQKTNKGKK